MPEFLWRPLHKSSPGTLPLTRSLQLHRVTGFVVFHQELVGCRLKSLHQSQPYSQAQCSSLDSSARKISGARRWVRSRTPVLWGKALMEELIASTHLAFWDNEGDGVHSSQYHATMEIYVPGRRAIVTLSVPHCRHTTRRAAKLNCVDHRTR